MYFAGTYSKFNEGDEVWFVTDEFTKRATVLSIGILGSKLSRHEFLYHIKAEDGEEYKVFDKCLRFGLDK